MISLQHWLLQFGVSSMGLRQIIREFRDKRANGCLTWEAYRALILGCLIDIDK